MSGRVISIEAYDDPDQGSFRSQGASSTERGRALRVQLINRGVDREVLVVLDTTLSVGRQAFTLLDTIGHASFRSSSRDPGYLVVETVDRALAARRLSFSQKTTLFSILGWNFECLKCKRYKKPTEFENTSFIL